MNKWYDEMRYIRPVLLCFSVICSAVATAETLYCPVSVKLLWEYRNGSGHWSTVSGNSPVLSVDDCAVSAVKYLKAELPKLSDGPLSAAGAPTSSNFSYEGAFGGPVMPALHPFGDDLEDVSMGFNWPLLSNGKSVQGVDVRLLTSGHVDAKDKREVSGLGYKGHWFSQSYYAQVLAVVRKSETDQGETFTTDYKANYTSYYNYGKLSELFRGTLSVT